VEKCDEDTTEVRPPTGRFKKYATKAGKVLRAIAFGPPIALPLLIWVLPQIPFALAAGWKVSRRRRGIAARMRATGRLVSWGEIRPQIEQGRGTLIDEFVSKDSSVLWWTAEDVSAISPHRCCLKGTYRSDIAACQPFFDWCRARYTDLESGKAQLVDLTKVNMDDFGLMEKFAGRQVAIPPKSKRRVLTITG
jgi:hypothetical protein